MRILVTGADGFIGKNLLIRLNELDRYEVVTYTRKNSVNDLPQLLKQVDAIIHLAGENRPLNELEFKIVNTELTQSICDVIRVIKRHIPIVLASSVQADLDNPYGNSKLAAELALEKLALDTHNPVFIYRLPGVFGKWCKPNYNSVVATFCHNIANDLAIQVSHKNTELTLVYIDDVVSEFINVIQFDNKINTKICVKPEYKITLGELAKQIKSFQNCRTSLLSEPVGEGLIRTLYSTYISYLPLEKFSYSIPIHSDERGVFAEILKTKNSGQFSFFTAHPGITRGGHYHHTKTEKFMVVKGSARFGFRHIITGKTHEIIVHGSEPKIVDSVPGWVHNITNIGDDEMIVMLWANEVFDKNKPDTIMSEV